MRPPTRIDVSERRFLGLTYRQLMILATAAFLALGCLVGLKTWAIWIRVVIVIGTVSLGLVWAFWQSHGQTLEQRLLDILVFHRRTRHLLHRALRQSNSGRAVWPTGEAKSAAPRKAQRTAALSWQPALLWITANALGISILLLLTLWLQQGGAHQLELLWHPL
jgi:hypothetical protein